MEDLNEKDIAEKLSNMSVMEIVSLTKLLENKWDIKASAPAQIITNSPTNQPEVVAQTEFNVTLISVPADKKMQTIKAIREVMTLGLKESKDFVEAAPKLIKEAVSKEEAETIKVKLTEAGAIVEIK